MAKSKKLKDPVTLFCAIESKMHGKLRRLAYKEKRSLADVVREALSTFLKVTSLHGGKTAKKREMEDSRRGGPRIDLIPDNEPNPG